MTQRFTGLLTRDFPACGNYYLRMAASPDLFPAAGPASVVDWGRCLEQHGVWLRRVILARTGDAQAVDEVFQQVAVAAVEQKSPLADPGKAAPWLHRLAVIHSARFRRQRGRERRALGSVARQRIHQRNGHCGNILEWLVDRERQERTRLALERLAGRDAEILLLKYADQWSYRQIAEHLGLTEKAVDSRLLRARARLREQLIALDVDETES